jgi:hypothetical protein
MKKKQDSDHPQIRIRTKMYAGTFQTLLPLVQEYPTTQLKSHVYEAHKMAAYRFQCGFCPKKFDTKAHIKVHTRQALQQLTYCTSLQYFHCYS